LNNTNILKRSAISAIVVVCMVLSLFLAAVPANAANEQQKLTASYGASGDAFGQSVSISGETDLRMVVFCFERRYTLDKMKS
jgi:hypothetical protein